MPVAQAERPAPEVGSSVEAGLTHRLSRFLAVAVALLFCAGVTALVPSADRGGDPTVESAPDAGGRERQRRRGGAVEKAALEAPPASDPGSTVSSNAPPTQPDPGQGPQPADSAPPGGGVPGGAPALEPGGPVAPPQAPGGRPLGTVGVGAPVTGCPLTQCFAVTVACPGVDVAGATVAIEPSQGTPRGVIVLFSGGLGTSFWAGAAATSELVASWSRIGLEVIDVAWSGGGWAASAAGRPDGFAALSCRPATIVAWANATRFSPLGVDPGVAACGLCVVGNSGGASQAAYGLTHYGLDGVVDALILTAGPPHADIERGCSAQPGDESLHYGSAAPAIDGAYGGSPGPCAAHDLSFAPQWRQDGLVTGGTDFVHPTTRILMILGSADHTAAFAQGQLYADRLVAAGSPRVTVRMIQGEGHDVRASSAGLAAVDEGVRAS